MTTLSEIASTASKIITVVAPIIEVAMPGSPIAQKIAAVLEVAGNYLKFGQTFEDKYLSEIASDMQAINDEVTEMAKAGTGVPLDKWDAVGVEIDDAAARIRKAMGLPDPTAPATA